VDHNSEPAVIQVDMSVERYQEFHGDGLVEVWGWVGDYEVCVWLPMNDPRLQSILPQKKTRTAREQR
jgi:hypothetical protein